jgi:transcriptional regulator with XRE-family HTH domain
MIDEHKPTWEEFAREIGLNLRRVRKRKGLSQEAVARRAGIATYTYSKAEQGLASANGPLNPQLLTLIKILHGLDVSILEILPANAPDMQAERERHQDARPPL